MFQYGGRIYWDLSAVTTVFAQIAGESRDFSGPAVSGSDSDIVWALGLNWNPSPMIEADFTYSRINAPSLTSAGENYGIDTITARIWKRISDVYYVQVVGSYANSEYESTAGGAGSGRSDDFWTAYAEIGRELSDYGRLGVFYNFLSNDSSIVFNSFEGHSVGLKLGVEF